MGERKRIRLNGTQLKFIALVTMLIDHIGYVLFPEVTLLRIIGRLAFPLYCFLLAEGMAHTSNWKKYALRLFVFAVISEIPYDLITSNRMIDWSNQSVFLTLFMGLITMVLYDTKHFLGYIGIGFVVIFGNLLGVDYGSEGVLLAFILYVVRKDDIRWPAMVTIVWSLCYGGIQYWAMLSAIFMLLYNKERGWNPPALKYGFYAFYPVHLLVLYVIAMLIN